MPVITMLLISIGSSLMNKSDAPPPPSVTKVNQESKASKRGHRLGLKFTTVGAGVSPALAGRRLSGRQRELRFILSLWASFFSTLRLS